jgi:DNA-binding Lrp family transcriptional regulator
MDVLDKKDRALIKELDFDARASISSLAKRILTSKEVANYRLKRLLDNKVIKGFTAIIDSYALGYQIYRLQIRFARITSENKKELIEWAMKNESIAWVVTLGGKWDIVLLFWARSPPEFNQIYESFLGKFGLYIHRKNISILTEIEHRPLNFLYDKMIDNHISVGSFNDLKIDEMDKKILDILSKNGRAQLIEISQKVGITANAVKYRMKNLEEKNIIKGYRLVINPKFFELSHYKVLVRLLDPSKRKELMAFLRQKKSVVYISQSLGNNDLEFEMLCKFPVELYSLIDEFDQLKPGLIRDFEEILTLEEKAIDYFPNK